MGKDKHTFTKLSENKQHFYKELVDRCEEDITNVLQIGGLPNDLYRECWLKGFQYAYERIKTIFELKGDKIKLPQINLFVESLYHTNEKESI